MDNIQGQNWPKVKIKRSWHLP